MKKKYILTDETITLDSGIVLHRIKAIRSFNNANEGDLGGWIEKEDNLSHEGDCWVYGNAAVYGNAEVYDNVRICDNATVRDKATVCDNATVYGNAIVYGSTRVYDNAIVRDNAEVYGKTLVYGNAIVYGNTVIRGNAVIQSNKDYIVFKNWWSSGRYFTWTRSNNMWHVGCFYGTGDELIKKAYKDTKISGREYERVVKYVESILKEEEK
jgi:carbonic anhydrase/acetyltransferase-like protein (isoleucine patch superfamily)